MNDLLAPSSLDELCKHFNPTFLKVGLKCTPSIQSKCILDKLNDGVLIVKGFDDLSVSLQDFDWIHGIENRSWWWQIQALPYLNNFVDAATVVTSIENERYFNLTKKLIFSWIEKSSRNKNSPLAWHDHASAYRLRNIVRWIAYIHKEDLIIFLTLEEQNSLLEIILEHVRWLGEEGNYSKHTNHGFDQMLILYRTCLIFSTPGFLSGIKELSKNRLLDELSFSFTDQGVHKENSPGYQQFMLSRIKELIKLSDLGDIDICDQAQLLIDRAEGFLHAITLPNNKIPIIGDTQSIKSALPVAVRKQCTPYIDVFDYSQSGYIILTGVNIYHDDFHFIFKSSHFSSYHRHDDDLSIHWYVNDEVIIGDSGLFSHEEKEHKRMYMRSPFAHSAPFITNIIPERTPDLLQSLPNCYIDKNKKYIKAFSTAFGGIKIERIVDYSKILFNSICIEDTVVSTTNESLCINFIHPEQNQKLIVNNNRVFLKSEKNQTTIECDDDVDIYSFFGMGSTLDNTAITSNTFNSYHDCFRTTFSPKQGKSKLLLQSTPKSHKVILNKEVFNGDLKNLSAHHNNGFFLVKNNNNHNSYLTLYNCDFSFEETREYHIRVDCDVIKFSFNASSNNLNPELLIIFYGIDNKKSGMNRVIPSTESIINIPSNSFSFKLYMKIPKNSECCIENISWVIDFR
ncbi:heparinase II/III domain-containing protein [Aeromonas rivipollensis]|uniref:heparinase II/III domain-containing protein n=1 Tax=Aeromonas rivipollensis TaxID=948519 RepID=UPI003D23B3FE